MVIPLSFSSGALSIESNERNSERPFFANTELDTQLLFDEGVTAKGKPLVHHLMNEDLSCYIFNTGNCNFSLHDKLKSILSKSNFDLFNSI